MELKCWCASMVVLVDACFNRTFMELKSPPMAATREDHEGFNRTFMELKWCRWCSRGGWCPRFNRTFMELK